MEETLAKFNGQLKKKDTLTGYFRSQHKVGYKDYKQAVRQVTLTVTNFIHHRNRINIGEW